MNPPRVLLTTVLAIGLGTGLGLGGCSFATDVGQDPAATAPPTGTPLAPVPSPPETSAPSDGSGLPVLTLQGFGGLRYGMAPDEASQALGVDLVPDPGYPDAYADSRELFACGFLQPEAGDLPEGIRVMVTGPGEGTVARVDVVAGPYRTESGISIGAGLAAVQGVQSEGVVVEPAPYGDGQQVTVNPLDDAATTAEVFDLDAAGTVTAFRTGQRPEVGFQEGCV